ncbi:hypothetical protein [Streptomyces sp. NPDC058326]|uniref:hypothetical protein n=1 Tax=Streptomyces sp. NPDC058326 TaxID=3346447 RepID=UPI0036E9B733
MPAPSTAAGQTSATPAPALAAPRGRRRAPAPSPLFPAATTAGETAGETETAPGAAGAVPGTGAADQAGDVVRWAVFCCVLVPVVLVVYGTSLGGAAGTALGLLSVTAACRVLLRRSERGGRRGAGETGSNRRPHRSRPSSS